MKLSTWAKKRGISYYTAWRWFRDGNLPVRAEQTETGTILVFDEEPTTVRATKVVTYARVSCANRKGNLTEQQNRLREFCAANGMVIADEVAEIGSGLNGTRRKLLSILQDDSITHIIVEHKDRLARFGVEMLMSALKPSGRRIIVVNEVECKDDIAQDFIDLATSMCARIYGRRSAKNRANRCIKAADDNR